MIGPLRARAGRKRSPVALILKRTLLAGDPESFLMELPTYRWPQVRTVCHRVYERGQAFCVQAGTVIFAMTLIVWALGYYPRSASVASDYDLQRDAVTEVHDIAVTSIAATFDAGMTGDALPSHEGVGSTLATIEAIESEFESHVADEDLSPESPGYKGERLAADEAIATLIVSTGSTGDAAWALHKARRERDTSLAQIEREESGAYLRSSFLGRMGAWIEPVVRPLGWDWRIGTAVLASFPAREVVIASLGTIYNLGGDQDEGSVSLKQRMLSATWPDGSKVFNLAVALSVMVFFALCCQCGATLAVIRRETNSWRWPALTFFYMTALAYAASLITYQVAASFV